MSSEGGRGRRRRFAPMAALGMLVVIGAIAPAGQVTATECARLAKDPPSWPDHVEIRDKAIPLSYGQAQQATANAIYPVIGLLVAGVSATFALIAIGPRDRPRNEAKELAQVQ